VIGSLSAVKRTIALEELVVVDERVLLLIVLYMLLVQDDMLIEDAVGSVKIHHSRLILVTQKVKRGVPQTKRRYEANDIFCFNVRSLNFCHLYCSHDFKVGDFCAVGEQGVADNL